MENHEQRVQNYFGNLVRKLDDYYLAVLNKEPLDVLNAELKGYLEAGMILKLTSREMLQDIITERHNSILGVSDGKSPAGGSSNDADFQSPPEDRD